MKSPPELSKLSLDRRPRKLSDEVTQVLQREIEEKRLVGGDRLPTEQELARSFGVSRTVIREAIAKLCADGLVVPRQGSGVFISDNPIDQPFRIRMHSGTAAQSILDVFELRIGVESEAAALAAERRTDEQLQTIESIRNRIATAIDAGLDATDEDVAFHQAISVATNNPQFVDFIRFIAHHLYEAVRQARTNSARYDGRPRRVEEEHEAIVQAIQARDSAAAEAAMRRHLKKAQKRLMESANEPEGSSGERST